MLLAALNETLKKKACPQEPIRHAYVAFISSLPWTSPVSTTNCTPIPPPCRIPRDVAYFTHPIRRGRHGPPTPSADKTWLKCRMTTRAVS